jgi:hypothetical protein
MNGCYVQFEADDASAQVAQGGIGRVVVAAGGHLRHNQRQFD